MKKNLKAFMKQQKRFVSHDGSHVLLQMTDFDGNIVGYIDAGVWEGVSATLKPLITDKWESQRMELYKLCGWDRSNMPPRPQPPKEGEKSTQVDEDLLLWWRNDALKWITDVRFEDSGHYTVTRKLTHSSRRGEPYVWSFDEEPPAKYNPKWHPLPFVIVNTTHGAYRFKDLSVRNPEGNPQPPEGYEPVPEALPEMGLVKQLRKFVAPDYQSWYIQHIFYDADKNYYFAGDEYVIAYIYPSDDDVEEYLQDIETCIARPVKSGKGAPDYLEIVRGTVTQPVYDYGQYVRDERLGNSESAIEKFRDVRKNLMDVAEQRGKKWFTITSSAIGKTGKNAYGWKAAINAASKHENVTMQLVYSYFDSDLMGVQSAYDMKVVSKSAERGVVEFAVPIESYLNTETTVWVNPTYIKQILDLAAVAGKTDEDTYIDFFFADEESPLLFKGYSKKHKQRFEGLLMPMSR
jgi:hypothetical protein